MKYCSNCGAKIKDEKAVVCTNCGVSLNGATKKSKAIAILLAIFLSYWTWLYTYRKDYVKFWLGLILSVIGIFLLLLPNLIVWVWSMVDTAIKPQSWYDNY